MQEALVGAWDHDPHLSAEALRSLRDLNHRFLDLAATRGDWLAERLAPLSAAQRAAAASCPYALFDLRFQDEVHWQVQLPNAGSWCVADECATDDATVDFVRPALFYAWHVAWGAGLKAQLLLGMNATTAAAFRCITVNQLSALAAIEARYLSPRWTGCTAYWSALTAAAACADPRALHRVQLHGLQLAAAARLLGA